MTWGRPGKGRIDTDPGSAETSSSPPQPDHAWKALSLVVDWIKHAETKAGAVLAASGVSGGVLYNLVKAQAERSAALNVAAGGAGALLFVSALCAALALRPRLRSTEEPTSNLYYLHIAKRHSRSGGSQSYSDLVLEVTSDGTKLVNEIAGQVWANAHVANDKYKWINRAMAAFLLSLLFLAAVPVIITFGWTG